MTFFNKLWAQAASYFSDLEKYGEDNNINAVTVTNLAKDIGHIAAKSVENAAENAANALADTPATIYQWAGTAGTSAMSLGYKALKGTHDWYFGETAGGAQENSAAMAMNLAGAAGSKALDLGHSALKGTHDWYFGETAGAVQESSAAMAMNLAGAAGSKALDLGYSALKGTHDWYFGETAGAVQESSAAMAMNLAGAAGSKALDLSWSALKGAYDWYFDTPANDAGGHATPEGGDAPIQLAAAADQDDAYAPAVQTANTDDAPVLHTYPGIIHATALPTSALIPDLQEDASESDFGDAHADGVAIQDAGHNLDYPADDLPMDHFHDLSMMNSFAMSAAVSVHG